MTIVLAVSRCPFEISSFSLSVSFPVIGIVAINRQPFPHIFAGVTVIVIMVLSSHTALNKVKASSIETLDAFIAQKLGPAVKEADLLMKPLGLHFVVKDKIFMGKAHSACCPIRLLLQDGSGETKLCKVIWRDRTERSKVIRKVKFGVNKFSVICLDDFTVISDEHSVEKTGTGYHFFTCNYHVVKKDVSEETYLRWLT
jgi:hypothetical protein